MKNETGETGQLTFFALLSFAFFLTLVPVLSSVSLGLTVFLWLKNKTYKRSFELIRRHKTWWFFIAFYLFHVASLLWSENIRYAFFDLQVKVAYLICPVVFAGYYLSASQWKQLRRVFIGGTALAALLCFCRAVWMFAATGDRDMLFYDNFSLLMHPTYFMIHVNLSMLFILYDLFWEREENRTWRRLYSGILFSLLIAIFLLSARTSLATSLLTFFIFCIVMFRKGKLGRRDAFPVFLFFGFAILFQAGLLVYYNRYDQITKLIGEQGKKEENSTSIRFNLWKTAAEVIREHPVAGVGIGDIKEELVKKYTANNYEYGIKNRISPHNQYLHTAVILGFAGVAMLVAMLLASFILAYRNGDWVYALFIVIISLNAMTESILERQAGILFFVFFNSLFASRHIGGIKNALPE